MLKDEELAAELAVRNLIAKMAHMTDGGDLDSYARLLDGDCHWVMPRAEPLRGRDAIVEAARARRAAGTTGPGSGNRHMVTTVTVEVQVDQAVARSNSYWMFLSTSQSPPAILGSGTYQDTFRLTDSGWVFAERVASP